MKISDSKQMILLVFYFFMTHLGVIRFFYWLNRRKNVVLTYHNVIPDALFDHSPHLGVSHSETRLTTRHPRDTKGAVFLRYSHARHASRAAARREGAIGTDPSLEV